MTAPPSTPRPPRRPQRGQTLLLWALTLLVLTLMVCIVLSVGTRVREKIETQTLADTAAYSNAVATARTYNSVSLMNRTQVSHMVAQAGVHSLVDWSTQYLSALSAAHWDLTQNFNQLQCGFLDPTCPCKVYTKAMLILQSISVWIEEFMKFFPFLGMDWSAAIQARRRWEASMELYALEMESYNMDLQGAFLGGGLINNQNLGSKVAGGATPGTPLGGELSAPGGFDSVSKREISISLGCITGGGAGCEPPIYAEHAVEAAMGSRGYPFVTARTGGAALIMSQINQVLSRFPTPMVTSTATVTGEGAGYFSPIMFPFHGILPPLGRYSSADDHGFVTVNTTSFMCGASSGWLATSWLMAGDQPFLWFGTSQHVYSILPQLASLSGIMGIYPGPLVPMPPLPWTPLPVAPPVLAQEIDASAIHKVTLLPWIYIWPIFIDYNFQHVKDGSDNFGQPKNMAVIQRDYRARTTPDPFNLFFNFRFDNSGGGSQFDNRGLVLTTPGYTTDISKMTAMATGIAYYHRGGHWREPPNFLSPFWRATLVAADTDQQGQTDPASLMSANGQTDAAALWNALKARNFQGIQ